MTKVLKDQGREEGFAKMAKQVEEVAPGIMDLLQAYGGYEEALRMARYYLALLQPQLWIVTSNSSQ